MKIKMNKTVGSYIKGHVYEVVSETIDTYLLKNNKGICMTIHKRNCEPVGFLQWIKRVF